MYLDGVGGGGGGVGGSVHLDAVAWVLGNDPPRAASAVVRATKVPTLRVGKLATRVRRRVTRVRRRVDTLRASRATVTGVSASLPMLVDPS